MNRSAGSFGLLRKKHLRPVLLILTALCVSAGLAILLLYNLLPDPSKLLDSFSYKPLRSEKYKSLRVHKGDTRYTRLENLSPLFIDTLLVAEDGQFFSHKGFNFKQVMRAIAYNVSHNRDWFGASSISQQLVKNIYLSPEKTIGRKLKEALLTIKLENRLTKEAILELYINVVEFGPEIYGLHDATAFYFEKKPEELDPLEMAYVIALLPKPRAFDQIPLPEPVASRLLKILTWMRTEHTIDFDQYIKGRSAIYEPTLLTHTPRSRSGQPVAS